MNANTITVTQDNFPDVPSSVGSAGWSKDKTYSIADGVTWTLNSNTDQWGFFNNSTIKGENSTLKLEVANTGSGYVGIGCGGATINVDTLEIQSNQQAIFVTQNGVLNNVDIKARVIDIKGGTHATILATTSQGQKVGVHGFDKLDVTSKNSSAIRASGAAKVEFVGNTGSVANFVSTGEGYSGNSAIDARVNSNVSISADEINISSTITDNVFAEDGPNLSEYKKQSVAVMNNATVTLASNVLNVSINGADAENALWVRNNGTLNLNAKTAKINGDISATSGTINLNGNLIFNGEEAYIDTLGGSQATITLTDKYQDFHIVNNNNNALTIAADKNVVSTIGDLQDIATVENNDQKVTWLINGGFDGDITQVGEGPVKVVASKEVRALQSFSTNLLSKGVVFGLKNDVRKRLGDIHHVDAEQGAWVRYEGGRMSASGYSNKLNTLQIGYDTKALADGVRLGAAVSYTRNDAELDGGAADTDTYALSLYGTWMGDNGMYADVIARVASVKNDVTVFGNTQNYNDDMSNTAYSITGEFGQRFDIAKTFFVEPQVEMVYTYIDSGKLHMADTATKFDSIDSLIGRAGMVFGWTCPNDKGHVYFRASALHEFKGDSKLTTNSGNTFKTDGQDTWAELGLGAQYNVNKNIHVWADVERTQGAEVNEDFRGTLGVRVSF